MLFLFTGSMQPRKATMQILPSSPSPERPIIDQWSQSPRPEKCTDAGMELVKFYIKDMQKN